MEPGQIIDIAEVPVRRAGIYVPSGRAPYPSTVVMCAVTARAAGVAEIAVCAPPSVADARVHPLILVACALCEVHEVYRVGGAQAIAALAYGTESIKPVDVIAGPGGQYVTEAKRQVQGVVGIDSLAGPSELVVVATDSEVVITGQVSSYYLKQLAQEAVRPSLGRRRLLNRVEVCRAN